MSIYAVSDIHGYYDLFTQGLEEIGFSNNDFLWCLGDAIDRGSDGIKLLQHIMNHDNMDMIIGNHELMMLNSVSSSGDPVCDGQDTTLWLSANGGEVTYEHYISLSREEREALLAWLKQRYVIKTLDVEGRPYCLTHSFYNPNVENMRYSEMSYSNVWSITWSSIWREDSLTHAEDIYPQYDYTFINGHVSVQSIRLRQEPQAAFSQLKSIRHENVINIDGGCAIGHAAEIKNGAIFLRLDDLSEYPVELM